MLYKSEGYFLAKRSYSFKDNETGELKSFVSYDCLIYDGVQDWGFERPRIATVTKNASEPLALDGIKLMQKILVVMELSFNKATGTLKPKFTGVELVK